MKCRDCDHYADGRWYLHGRWAVLCFACVADRLVDENGVVAEARERDEDDGVTYGDPRNEMDERMDGDW